MKIQWLLFIAAAAASIVDTETDLICSPQNPTDCYPRIFVPTSEWQNIREGQDIPAGLHVRLNIDTLQREAKLMEPEQANSDSDSGIVLVPGEEVHDVPEDLAQDEIQRKINEFRQQKLQKQAEPYQDQSHDQIHNHNIHSSHKVNHDDLTSFDSAVAEIISFSGDNSRLSQALDTLIDLSHDIEFGVKLTASRDIFDSLLEIGQSHKDDEITEKVYRIMGASLRNNPDSVTNLLRNSDGSFVAALFSNLSTQKDVIQKRILGIIQGLAQNSHFAYEYFSHNKNHGISNLISVYPQLGPDSRERCVNILEDLNLLSRDDFDRRAVEEFNNADLQISRFLQESLSSNEITSPIQFRTYFDNLVTLHERNKELKPTSDFLKWLATEVETRKSYKKREDYPQQEKDYDEKMLHARHVVFGNPLGLRKAIADEL
ncbi:hypothetical protein G9P44_003256 [Scheffersomyces stipitis]|nr:hypothetical protein G9P44_003256 [Scheffersomyces stipitis]